jgi:hypothetical protein
MTRSVEAHFGASLPAGLKIRASRIRPLGTYAVAAYCDSEVIRNAWPEGAVFKWGSVRLYPHSWIGMDRIQRVVQPLFNPVLCIEDDQPPGVRIRRSPRSWRMRLFLFLADSRQ